MAWKNDIQRQTMEEGGFLDQLRASRIDEAGYEALAAALRTGTEEVQEATAVERRIVACLFEVPYEVENTQEHYTRRSEADGRRVAAMAEELRRLINGFLWAGVDT